MKMNESEYSERLKSELRKLETLWFSENYRMRELLTRAADALEEEFGPADDPAYGVKGPVHELIAELRKAVE